MGQSEVEAAPPEGLRAVLQSGDWLTRERVRLVAAALLFASVASLLYLVLTARNGIDLQGRPLGTDFANVYAGGTLADAGEPTAVFDPQRQFARERELFGADTQFYGWPYPPFFLMVAAPLAKLPYGLALALWQGLTLALYLLTIRAIAASARVRSPGPQAGLLEPSWLLVALAFPAVLVTLGHGQNGFLNAALLGGGLVLLERRPVVAGILFGLLIYKPQFGLMIPVALAADGRWKSFAAAAVTVAVLTVAVTLSFGASVWSAFLASTEFTRSVILEQDGVGWYKLQSVFAWSRMWGAPVPLAYDLQGLITVAVGLALFRLWRGPARYAAKAAALCLASMLATPYCFDYDMMMLAPAIAFLTIEGLARGFAAYEKTTLAALWLTPLLARSTAQLTSIPLGVPMMLATFVLVILHHGERKRARQGQSAMTFSRGSSTLVADKGGTSRHKASAP